MSASSPSAARPTAYTSSPTPGTRAPGADTASGVARARMTTTTSASGAALTSTDYDFQQHLETAELMVLQGKNLVGHEQFKDIDASIEKAVLPKTSFFPVRCLLGLAYSSPTLTAKTDYTQKAYKALDRVYAARANWQQEERSPSHAELSRHLKKLMLLIPPTNFEMIADIKAKIAECTQSTLPIDAFREKVREADEAFKRKDLVKAGQLYNEALPIIVGRSENECRFALVDCFLKLTKTYPLDDRSRASTRDRAQAILFDLYDQRVSLYGLGSKYTKVGVFTALFHNLIALRELTLKKDPNHNAIEERIEAIRSAIPEEAAQLRRIEDQLAAAADPSSGPTGSDPLLTPGRRSRRVSEGSPDGSWSLVRLFLGVVCLAAIAVVGVTLYRRYNVKAN